MSFVIKKCLSDLRFMSNINMLIILFHWYKTRKKIMSNSINLFYVFFKVYFSGMLISFTVFRQL